jgi:hypothetical protein
MIMMLTSSLFRTSQASSRRVVVSLPQCSARFFAGSAQEREEHEDESSPPPRKNNAHKDLTDLPISFADISRAEVAIKGGVKRTACELSPFISELVGANVFLKAEFRQFTGSFKERGARNAILQLIRQKQKKLKGVIAASAGNHALGLSYHGKDLGVPCTVVMPTVAPMAKVEKCRVSFTVAFALMTVPGTFLLIHSLIINLLSFHVRLAEIRGTDYHSRRSHWRSQRICRKARCK